MKHLIELELPADFPAVAAPAHWTVVEVEYDRGDFRHRRLVTLAVHGGRTGAMAARDRLIAEFHDATRDRPKPWTRVYSPAGRADYREQRIRVALDDEHPDTLIALNAVISGHRAGLRRDYGEPGRTVIRRDIKEKGADERSKALLEALTERFAIESATDWHVTGGLPHLDEIWADHKEEAGSILYYPHVDEDWPATYLPIGKPRLPAVFDPALTHYDSAYRVSEPPEPTAAWTDLRTRAIEHIAAHVARLGLKDTLILRGAVPLRTWFGPAARPSGELDFILRTEEKDKQGVAGELLNALTRSLEEDPGPGLHPEDGDEDEIWLHDRTPGHRVVIPVLDGETETQVQVDVFFDESLPREPEPITIGRTELMSASKELSLAWKLRWLHTDGYPQGKDLYDAVLLAEHTTPDHELIREVLAEELGRRASHWIPSSTLSIRPDWQNPKYEYPGLIAEDDTAGAWLNRLARALV